MVTNHSRAERVQSLGLASNFAVAHGAVPLHTGFRPLPLEDATAFACLMARSTIRRFSEVFIPLSRARSALVSIGAPTPGVAEDRKRPSGEQELGRVVGEGLSGDSSKVLAVFGDVIELYFVP